MTTWYAEKCKVNLISEFWAWKFMKFRKILSTFMKYFQFRKTVFVHHESFSSKIEWNSKVLWNLENFEKKWPNGVMIVLCEIGWPQKSPWVRMIWMISCKETIKINSKTWLRFYLIIKTNISKFLIFWTHLIYLWKFDQNGAVVSYYDSFYCGFTSDVELFDTGRMHHLT